MELAPVLAAIYTQSIESGEVPTDWTQALSLKRVTDTFPSIIASLTDQHPL